MQIARVHIGVDVIYSAPTKVQITSLKPDRELSQTISEPADVTPMTQFPATSLKRYARLACVLAFVENLYCVVTKCVFPCRPLSISSSCMTSVQALIPLFSRLENDLSTCSTRYSYLIKLQTYRVYNLILGFFKENIYE